MGASWKSLVVGFVAGIANYFAALGPNLPATPADWGHVLVSAAIIALGSVVKDFNVSNAQTPAAPTAVPPAMMDKPNPVASAVPPTAGH
jgi:hypothetical protein